MNNKEYAIYEASTAFMKICFQSCDGIKEIGNTSVYVDNLSIIPKPPGHRVG
jgi:hypothetical protein